MAEVRRTLPPFPSRSGLSEGVLMARIMHVITGLDTGGAEMMLWKLLSATNDRHRQAVVSLTNTGPTGERIQGLGIPVHSLGLRPAAPSPLRALTLRSLTRQFSPHLIQGWLCHGNLMASLAAGWARRRPPVIWCIRQSLYSLADERWLTAAVIRLNACLSSRVANIVYVSRTNRQQHEALGYDTSRGLVIPNGFDCRTFVPDDDARRQVRAELGVPQDAVLIGLVARYHPMKDHAGFLRAAAVVAEACPSVRFALVGRGIKEQPSLAALITELGIASHVLLLGERHDTPRLTAALDIACSASWAEAFCTAIGEAMACGVPCVATDVGDNACLVGDTGFCVPPRDPQALAQAILRMIDAGPERRRQIGAAARRRVEEEFSLPEIVSRYEALYEKHLGPSLKY